MYNLIIGCAHLIGDLRRSQTKPTEGKEHAQENDYRPIQDRCKRSPV